MSQGSQVGAGAHDGPVDAVREARQRVLAARNNLIAVGCGRLEPTVTMASTIVLLEQAAVWLDGTAV
jgi:hypothetical protein